MDKPTCCLTASVRSCDKWTKYHYYLDELIKDDLYCSTCKLEQPFVRRRDNIHCGNCGQKPKMNLIKPS